MAMINLAFLDGKLPEMAIFFDKLPTILVLAVMVGIFVALRRHVKSPRLHLWIGAWVLIFVHFFVQMFEPADGNLTPLTFMIDLGSLQLSALCFVASLTSFFEDNRLTFCLLALTGVPALAYTAGLAYELNWPWLYISSAAIIFLWNAVVRGASPQGRSHIFCLGANCCHYRNSGHGEGMAFALRFWFSGHSHPWLCIPGISFLQALSALVTGRCHQRRWFSFVGRCFSRRANDGCVGAQSQDQPRAVEYAKILCRFWHDPHVAGR